VPGDFSAAAFMVAAALRGECDVAIENVGVNPTRTGLLRVLERMGAAVAVAERRDAGGEPVADLVISPASLRGTTITADEVPGLIDEGPVLAALAATAEGETRITGAADLRVKE
jgi:3-phosphoshikimate 1-carboxyvinyltransferase